MLAAHPCEVLGHARVVINWGGVVTKDEVKVHGYSLSFRNC